MKFYIREFFLKRMGRMVFNHFENNLIWRIIHRKFNFRTHIDIEMGETLLLDELLSFHTKSKRIDHQISNTSPINNDIDVLTQYITEIKRMIKILRAKKKTIKKEINEFKNVSNLLNLYN